MNGEHLVVVGYGWVGQANALALTIMGYGVSYFDIGQPPQHYEKFANIYPRVSRLRSVLENDSENTCYIVCVGDRVSDDGVQDIGGIRTALDSLKGAKGTVILRSTIIPDHLESLRFDYYVPEFLHEKHAVEECISPYYVVVGNNNTRKREPSFLVAWRKRTPKHFDGTPREAAYVKYLSNLWNATRIAFVNEFGDAIAEPSSLKAVDSISSIMSFILGEKSYQRYGRGFDGHCLPKDMRAFKRWHKDKGRNVAMLDGAYQSNEAHILVEKTFPTLPKWFAEWGAPHLSGSVALREFLHSVWKNIFNVRGFISKHTPGRSI